jgi:hypothetical protein
MIVAAYAIVGILMAAGCLYLAWRSIDFRKFLAGAFFVSSGILAYLSVANVPVPLLGTGLVETPSISAARAVVHFVLFLICLYSGYFRRGHARLR